MQLFTVTQSYSPKPEHILSATTVKSTGALRIKFECPSPIPPGLTELLKWNIQTLGKHKNRIVHHLTFESLTNLIITLYENTTTGKFDAVCILELDDGPEECKLNTVHVVFSYIPLVKMAYSIEKFILKCQRRNKQLVEHTVVPSADVIAKFTQIILSTAYNNGFF